MSDISFNLDGLVAFLVAGLFALGLLLAVVITAIVASVRKKQPPVPFRRRLAFYILVGLSVSLLLNGAVMLILIASDGEWEIPGVAPWFDRNILIWEAIALAPIPGSIVAARLRQKRRAAGQNRPNVE
jgi:ABC-type Fe3+-siderophore transport system permease subunit